MYPVSSREKTLQERERYIYYKIHTCMPFDVWITKAANLLLIYSRLPHVRN